MKTKTFFIFAVLLFSVSISKAQLYFKNNSNAPVIVAYVMQSNDKSDEAWYSHGWYSCDPNATITLSSAVGLNPNVYWFAVTKDGKSSWNGKNRDGSISFLTDSQAFNIKNANLQYVKDQNPSYTWESFRHIEIGLLKTKYTIEITN
jgi:uncharacterized membrane protein